MSKLENVGRLLNFQVFCCACTKINTSLRSCTSPLFQHSGFSRKGNLIVEFWLLLFSDAHRSEWEKVMCESSKEVEVAKQRGKGLVTL